MTKQINKEQIMSEVLLNMVTEDFSLMNARKIISNFTLDNEIREINITVLKDTSLNALLDELSKEIDKIINEDSKEKIGLEFKPSNEEKYGINSKKEEVISSLGIQDYLESYLNNPDNSLKEKIIMSNFLNDYIDKDLYVVELFRDKGFYIRVENEDDEIISGELFVGVEVTKEETKNIDENIEHYELLTNTDMTINKFVDNILNDKEISAEDKIFMIRDFIKHLNKGRYRMDAEDLFGNMCQLVMDQNTHEIVDTIYY